MAEELSCLRRHRRTGNIAEVRQPRLCKGKRFNSQIISSMIESLIRGGSRRATGLRSCQRPAASAGRTPMANFEDKPPPAAGAFWVKEEKLPTLLRLFSHGDKIAPS